MGTSWRLVTKEVDRTERATTSTETIGAVVIKSPRGPNKFHLFYKGDTQGILDTFGYPSVDYPSIQDALDVITKCSMWVASPYSNGKFGGAFVTKKGTVPFINGVTEKKFNDYSQIPCTLDLGVTTESKYKYTLALKNFANYNKESLKLKLGEDDITLTFTQDTDKETFVGDKLLTNGSIDFTNGEMILEFENTIASGLAMVVDYTMDVSDTYFVLFGQNMQEDEIKVEVKMSEDVDDAFAIHVERYDPINNTYVELSASPYVVSLNPLGKDNAGSNIYIENILSTDKQLDLVPYVVNNVFDGFVEDKDFVEIGGGDRGTDPTGAQVASIYDEVQNTDKFRIKFAFDPTCSSEVITKFATLRNSYQKRCRFLYCTRDASASEIINSPSEFNGGINGNRGMYEYCLTWGIHKDVYNGNNFLCSNMGLIAGRLVDVLTAGGGVPAWIDENGVGGLLGGSITKLTQEGTTESELEMLDNLNFNAVVNDYTYGCMIVGWKTRQLKKTVYSSIGQSSLADTLIDLIERSVMPNRIAKLIDENAYTAVQSGCGEILRAYSAYLEDYYVLCDTTNNTNESRNQQVLNLAVGVIFKGYAEKVIFTFACYKNGVDVKEQLVKE